MKPRVQAKFGPANRQFRERRTDIMSLQEKLVKRLETQIDAWDKEIESAKAEAKNKEAQADAEKAEAQLREEMMDKVHKLQSKIEYAKSKIDEIGKAGEEQLDDLKTKLNDFLSE
jgi:exonuclease VII large subunit